MIKKVSRFLTGNPAYGDSLIDEHRLRFISSLAVKCAYEVKGSILEVGVFRGGSIKRIGESVRKEKLNNEIIGIDTFNGLPPGERWNNSKRMNNNNYFKVKKLLKHLKIVLIKGEFKNKNYILDRKRFCFIHLDCDLYKSYIDCLNYLKPKLNKGGIIFFDDYNSLYAKRANQAIHKVIPKNDIIVLDKKQAYWIKK